MPLLRVHIYLDDGSTKRFYWRSWIKPAYRSHLPIVGSDWDGRIVTGVTVIPKRQMRNQ